MINLTLSIGMIVKNESRHLKNCLTALKPLMNAVKSELIIADTGSVDDTLKIAKEFANKTMEIPWNNDFSEARNHTLRAAKGEWFMFIDADEYLEDSADLIKFFTSGQYKKYHGATYQVRNYLSDGISFNSPLVLRLCKITKDIRFDGYVHESLTIQGPICDLNSHARHHGYTDAADPDIFNRKHKRNLPLLHKAHDENPNDLNILKLLAKSYNSLGEPKKAKEYIDKGMSLALADSTHEMFPAFYRLLVEYNMKLATDESRRAALSVISEFFSRRQKLSVSAIDMYADKGECHFNLKEYKEAAEAFDKSYELIKQYLSGKLDAAEIHAVGTINSNESGLWMMAELAYESYVKLGDFITALERLALSSTSESVKEFVSHAKKALEYNRQNDKTAAMKQVKAAIKADSRYTRVIMSAIKMNPTSPAPS